MSYHRNNPISSRLANTIRLFPKTARLGIYVSTSKEEPPQSQRYIDLKPIRWADTFLNSLGSRHRVTPQHIHPLCNAGRAGNNRCGEREHCSAHKHHQNALLPRECDSTITGLQTLEGNDRVENDCAPDTSKMMHTYPHVLDRLE